MFLAYRAFLLRRVGRWMREPGSSLNTEDIVQDTLLEGFRDLAGLLDKSANGREAWLVRVARNRFVDQIRRRGRSREAGTEDGDLCGPEKKREVPDPRREQISRVLRFAASMSADERVVLTLRSVLRLDWESIMLVIDRPTEKSAKSLYARARSKLRTAVAP